jgi:hypothetical protein
MVPKASALRSSYRSSALGPCAVVGPSGFLYVPQVLLGRPPLDGVGSLVAQGLTPRAASPSLLLFSAALFRGIEGNATTSLGSRRRRIIRLSGKGSIKNGTPTPPPGSLTTRLVLRPGAQEGVPGTDQDKVPYVRDPGAARRGAHDEVRRLRLFLWGVSVKLPKEVADPRLLPHLVPLEVALPEFFAPSGSKAA